MKKSMSIAVGFLSIIFIASLTINPLAARTAKDGANLGNPIPESVMKIAQKSCVNCHAAPARGMSISMLNLSNWDKMTPEQQAKKAGAMCYMVTKGKMPPKKFKKSNPEGVPSKEEIATICDWSKSIQVPKK
jgi:hypothetical protein